MMPFAKPHPWLGQKVCTRSAHAAVSEVRCLTRHCACVEKQQMNSLHVLYAIINNAVKSQHSSWGKVDLLIQSLS